MQTNDINSRAMLVSLSTSTFNPTRLDRTATNEVIVNKNAAKDAGDFKRRIIPKEVIDPVMKASNAVYLTHKKLTSPWEDGGTRLLCIDMFDRYVDEINGERRMFEIEVDKFLKAYESIRANAPVRMGALYDPRDYPPIEVVREKFGIRTQWLPLPNGNDFRVHLQDDQIAELAESVDERVNAAVAAAREDLYDRLQDRLSKVSERLSKPENVFRDSLIDNLKELCDLVPKMCLSPDAALQQAIDRATLEITSFNPQDLRDDTDKRAKAKAAADDILRSMGGFINSNAA
jgi:uncharacterized protein YqfA (UPF0365 family)